MQNSMIVKISLSALLNNIAIFFGKANWSEEFLNVLEDVLPTFKSDNTTSLSILLNTQQESLTPLQMILQVSSILALGIENNRDLENNSPAQGGEKLVPVFDALFTAEKFENKGKFRAALKPLTLGDGSTSIADLLWEAEGSPEDEQASYEALWSAFINDFKLLKGKDPLAFTNSLLNLLKKYTWSIPSSAQEIPDIPLYDHLRTTAAISACLYEQCGEELENNPDAVFSEDGKKEERFFLLHGDLSGIQKFIYSLTTKAAGKSLKGRSFYLQLLSDAVARMIVHRFGFTDANIIYSAGGGFFILLPLKAQDEIDSIEEAVNNFLLDEFSHSLYFALDGVVLTPNDFIEGAISGKWDESIKRTNIKKLKKYSNRLGSDEDFFEPYEEKFADTDELESKYQLSHAEGRIIDSISEKGKVPPYYIKFVLLAKDLNNANIVIETVRNTANTVSPKKHSYDFIFPFAGQGNIVVSYQLSKEMKDITRDNSLKLLFEEADAINVNTLNKLDIAGILSSTSAKTSCGFKFYGGNTTPKSSDGSPKTLNAIAGLIPDEDEGAEADAVNPNKGLKRLGILRMDVDNLGETFMVGLDSSAAGGQNNSSITRIANLSFLLDLFFCGYLNKILARKYSENAYIVYSGGDDLFIVGSWEVMPELATTIYQEFRKFVLYHPKLTISGGIEITQPKFPIYRAAKNAGEKESLAKKFKTPGEEWQGATPKKDTLFLISQPLRLRDIKETEESDFYQVSSMKDALVNLINKTGNRGMLNRLREIYLEYKREYEELSRASKNEEHLSLLKNLQYNRWRWLAAYQLARFRADLVKADLSEDVQAEIKKLTKKVYKETDFNDPSQRDYFDILEVALRWAEFELRDKPKQEQNND